MSDAIRLATEDDLPRINDIYNAAVPTRMATADLEPMTRERRVEWFRKHDPARRPVWVLERDGEVAGWASLSDYHERCGYRATAECSLYVAPDCKGKGIGEALTRHAIAECPRVGVKTLLGLIFAHNAPSLRLAGKLGFERWGYLPGVVELEGVERDVVIMGLKTT